MGSDAKMTEHDRIIDAFRNCITEPKCKDCPWTECSTLNNGSVEVPKDLALAVMRELVDERRRWKPFNKRALSPEEKALHPDWVYIIDGPGYEETELLVTDGKNVWSDYFVNNGTECYLDSGREIEEGMAWMYLPEPYKEAKEHD